MIVCTFHFSLQAWNERNWEGLAGSGTPHKRNDLIFCFVLAVLQLVDGLQYRTPDRNTHTHNTHTHTHTHTHTECVCVWGGGGMGDKGGGEREREREH